MATKKNEFTLEELKQQYDRLVSQQNALMEQIEQKKQEEDVKLAEEKEARYAKAVAALEYAFKLVDEYAADYGSFTMNTDSDTWLSVFGNKAMHYYF
jgi:capsule polysaccharide export protein KpsE/RkpR